ncbi:hypothetical protein ACIPPM_25140 [Streptomyces sp. NPDC090119]|uniref:hypothetical protein n=1 Tax=Streptomyces sp. NPDC090119 TaxID=3365951 RepID=UPI0038131FCE
MRRIDFLRSLEIQQTKPFLKALEGRFREDGIEAKLFLADGECGPDDFPRDDDFPGESERVPGDISADELAKKVDNDILAGRGLRIPAHQDAVLIQTADMGHPVISKPLRDCMGAGTVSIPDGAALERHLADGEHPDIVITCELDDRAALPAKVESLRQRHAFTDRSFLRQIAVAVGAVAARTDTDTDTDTDTEDGNG